MPSIFTRIINGEIPCYKVAENEHCFAFLDINPLKEGHTLVIPKTEIDEVYEIPEDLFIELQKFSLEVAQAIKKAIPCERIGSAVVGLEVPHAHIHLIPIERMEDMNFANPKMSFTEGEFSRTAEAIRNHL